MLLFILVIPLLQSGCEPKEQIVKTEPEDPIVIKEPNESKPRLSCNPCLQGPEEWGSPADQVLPKEGQFWADDTPKELERLAFGILRHSPLYEIDVQIQNFELATDLLEVPDEFPVYMQGSYPAEHKELLKDFTPYHEVIEYHPAYSGLYFAGADPITEPIGDPTQEKIEQVASELMEPFLLPDSVTPTTIQEEDRSWVVIFYRHIHGYRIYVDKPLWVRFDQEGRAVSIGGRRRPIIEKSLYPSRSVEEAFELLQQGKWIHLYITDFSPAFTEDLDTFVIKEIKIIYHEQHPGYSKQVLQPYYEFRNEEGQALYVPAIADPYIDRY